MRWNTYAGSIPAPTDRSYDTMDQGSVKTQALFALDSENLCIYVNSKVALQLNGESAAHEAETVGSNPTDANRRVQSVVDGKSHNLAVVSSILIPANQLVYHVYKELRISSRRFSNGKNVFSFSLIN